VGMRGEEGVISRRRVVQSERRVNTTEHSNVEDASSRLLARLHTRGAVWALRTIAGEVMLPNGLVARRLPAASSATSRDVAHSGKRIARPVLRVPNLACTKRAYRECTEREGVRLCTGS